MGSSPVILAHMACLYIEAGRLHWNAALASAWPEDQDCFNAPSIDTLDAIERAVHILAFIVFWPIVIVLGKIVAGRAGRQP